ncbi:hypothetical protein F4859DRAFT_521071 [Xylaria cf. heliscus]|nr:hypothetical protein F4859DRAFT_521071 [Xylaria cf. heliscus]
MFRFWPFSRPDRPSLEHDPSHEDDGNQDVSIPSTRRVVFSAHSTCVSGYPSSGGVLVLPFCNGVDLAFLGLSRFDLAEREEDPAKEDLHCARMRKLGAWPFASVFEYETSEYFDPGVLDRKMLVVPAWPQSGLGVWVVTMNRFEAAQTGLGRVWNASSMDERCDVVEKLGGKFYHDPTLCPDLTL